MPLSPLPPRNARCKITGMIKTIATLAVSALFVTTAAAAAQDRKLLPLSEIVRKIEQQNLGMIKKVEWDDNEWEIELDTPDGTLKLRLDPATGDERRRSVERERSRELPPADAEPLSQIIAELEEQLPGARIHEIEFDDDHWEIELRHDGRKIEVKLKPMTGEPRRD